MDKKHSDHLYLLAFIDMTDRYDILLLEIRHLQKVIIDSLHSPTLFLPLRHEEDYIFGGWVNDDECCQLLDEEQNYAKVASMCVQRYPSPRDAVKHISKLSRAKLKNTDIDMPEKLIRFIGHLWAGDLWAGGERRHYHALRALQILKQKIIRDKLIFLTEAKNANIVELKNNRVTRDKAALMILRCGVLTKINFYIRILRTHQQQFGKSLDFGLQSYPRPGIERRRDIGIYNDFLSNRTHDLHKDMFHFIKSFLEPEDSDERPIRVKPMILHGWSQSPQVSSSDLLDDVSIALEEDRKEGKVIIPQHVSYVDTSFWSPDRPDLQPLVAKQVAISLAKNYLGGINDHFLSNSNDPFSHLIVSLHKVVNEFTAELPELSPVKEQYVSLINDSLAVDFLAASVKGVAYLYALFLSILGKGLGEQLRTSDKSIKLDILDDLTGAIGNYEQDFEWYFRLRITAFWLEKIIHTRYSSLDVTVLKGCREVCDEILDYLDSNRPSAAKRLPAGSLWKSLASEMEACIEKHAFSTVAKQWRLKRSNDTWCEKQATPGEKVYHRSTIRLDLSLQRFMFRGTLQQKGEAKRKPITNQNNINLYEKPRNKKIRRGLYKEFHNVYGLEVEEIPVPGSTEKKYSHPRWLYRQLHQIPFQCAIMRSIDLLGSPQEEKPSILTAAWLPKPPANKGKHQPAPHDWKDVVTEIHNDMSLGREKFSMGLEFYTWARESPRERLALSNNLIVFILPQLVDGLEVKLHLAEWLRGDMTVGRTYNRPETIRKTIKSLSNATLKEHYDDSFLLKVGAESINRAFSWVKDESCSEVRRMEQLAGYKLKSLLDIYDNYVEKPYIKDKKNRDKLNVLLALGAFLRIRSKTGKNDFYKLVLQAFNNNTSQKKALPERIAPVMLSRAVLTNHYALANPYPNSDGTDGINHNQNSMAYNAETLRYGMTRGNWSEPMKGNQEGKFSTILGRYDVVGITPARMPCKCKVLNFNSKLGDDEVFVNHFTRREIALPVNIYKVAENNKKTLFGIISISLQRRAMRLNLLYRILNAIDKKDASDTVFPKVENTLIKIINRHSNALHIQGYITDGWGDFLLVFETVDGKHLDKDKLMDDIFRIQQILYEDFMVDRTELIFTPTCIDYIPRLQNYDFSISVRMLEDRKLESSVEDFLRVFNDKKEQLEKALPGIKSSSICQTPGRTDLTIRFKLKENAHLDDFYSKFLNWMGNMGTGSKMSTWYPDSMSILDKVETTIERHSN